MTVETIADGRYRVERVLGGPDQLAAGVNEQGTHALTAAEHGVAHRVEESVGNLMIGAENFGELRVDSAAIVIETLGKRLW